MGRVIYLDERRARRARNAPDGPPVFFFDISSPLSYLMAERVERRLGKVEWVAADGVLLRRLHQGDAGGAPAPITGGEEDLDQSLRVRSEACARALRLPLVWPDRFPVAAPCAQRASAFACEIGAGSAFALAASRLAFCGGFDLEDPETLAEAAAAAGIPLDECLTAAGEAWRDDELETVARELHARGVTELPVIRVGNRWFQGEPGLLAAQSLLSEQGTLRSLAPLA